MDCKIYGGIWWKHVETANQKGHKNDNGSYPVVINRNDTPTLASCYCSFHSISWFREKQNKQRWADQTHTAREPQTMTSEQNGKPSGRPAWLAGPTKKQIEEGLSCLMNPHPVLYIKPNAAKTIYRFGISF